MKKILLLGAALLFNAMSAQVGVGTSTPNSSSILDVNVNNLPANGKKGILTPQVALKNNIDVTTIPNPANGLLVYNTVDSGTAPNNVFKDTFYKYNVGKSKWDRLYDENSVSDLKIPQIASIIGFQPSGNDTTYLGSDLGGNAIRIIKFDDVRVQTSICTYDTSTNEFTANKTGYYNFQVNMVVKGAYQGFARIGVSKPYTGATPTSLGNGTVAFFSQFYYDVSASFPVPLNTNGVLFMNAGEKVLFMTRYIDPTVNTLNVESLSYSRVQSSSVSVTYFSN